ncbi:MAG: VTT domain-containing protein [Desulfobulbus sp.]|nr:VTT domain-containing protein [Desulfobulbus sp.]
MAPEIEKFFSTILPSIEHFHLFGYWAAFFAALLETALVVGLLLPGSTFLLLLGALSASGHLDFGDLLWFAVAGAVLGDNFNYWLGRRYGHQWIRKGIWFLPSELLQQAHRFFDRHGAKSVFLGRFIPSVKEIVPFLAGSVGMSQRTFMVWNVLGAIGWGMEWISAGYVFGQSLKLAQVWISRVGMMLIVIVITWVLLWLLQRFVVRHGRKMWRVMASLGDSFNEALANNPYVCQLVRRHPDIIRFLGARADRSHFTGLPLTLFGLVFVYVLALFAGIVEDVVTSDPIVAIDHATAQLIAAFRAPEVITPVIWFTNLGTAPIVGILFGATCLLLWFVHRKFAVIGLLVSTLGASIFSMLGKLAFQRPRPIEAIILEPSYSFPSGHATISVAFYGFLGYLLIRFSNGWNARVKLFFVTAGFVLLIGLSRIVLGVHYLSDIWAGYLVGTMWLIIGVSVNEWLTANRQMAWNISIDRHHKIMAVGLAVITIAGVIGYISTRKLPVHAVPVETHVQVDQPMVDILRAENQSLTTTLLGTSEQPLSFILVAASKNELIAKLQQAGWLAADRIAHGNIVRLFKEGMDYTTSPLAPAFWNNQMNGLAFERPFKLGQGKALATIRIWHTLLRFGQEEIFVGIAREYVGVRWGIMHLSSPDVDAAAEQFVNSLQKLSQPLAVCRQNLVSPMVGAYLLGDRFFTKGQIWLLYFGANPDVQRLCETNGPEQ